MSHAELIKEYMPKLGKASYGKNCIRYRRAVDIQWGVLDEVLKKAYVS